MRTKTLKGSLIFHFSLIAITIFILIIVIFSGMKVISNSNKIISKENDLETSLLTAKSDHYKWSLSLLKTIYAGDEFKGSLDPKSCNFGEKLYGEIQNNAELSDFVKKVEPFHNAIHQSASEIIEKLSSGDKIGSLELYNQTIVPNINGLIKVLDDTINENAKKVDEAEVKFQTFIMAISFVSLVSILLTIGICIKLYVFSKREILVNLDKMGTEIKKLSEGDLELNFECNCRTSEMKDIRDALDFSVKELERYVHAIDGVMAEFADGNFTKKCDVHFLGNFAAIERSIDSFQNKMNKVLTDVSKATNQVSLSAEQVSGGAQILAQGATEQASSVVELSTSINDVSTNINNNANNSKEADSLGKETVEVINNGISEMKQMLKAIDDISKSSEGIEKIIHVIDDIAFQTNILALNAAVEAARAGAAGKGFAVVADEVRTLAQKSSEAAKNTTNLIENSLKAVNRGKEIAGLTNEAFEAVADKSSNVLNIISEIAVALQEQARSVTQISKGVDQISSVVQMNSATSEESAAASQELSGQANMLKSLIGQFRITDI